MENVAPAYQEGLTIIIEWRADMPSHAGNNRSDHATPYDSDCSGRLQGRMRCTVNHSVFTLASTSASAPLLMALDSG